MFGVHSRLQDMLASEHGENMSFAGSKSSRLVKGVLCKKEVRPHLSVRLTWRWSKCTECVMPPYLFTTTLVIGTAGPPVKVKGIVTVALYAGEALLRAPSSGLPQK